MDGGQLVSPTEFERISGKAASKKWKASIRIDKVGCHLFTYTCSAARKALTYRRNGNASIETYCYLAGQIYC